MNSDRRIKDLAVQIDSMCPIKIVVNNRVVWDESHYTIPAISECRYLEFLKREEIVSSIKFKIVGFHHSIVYIKTVRRRNEK